MKVSCEVCGQEIERNATQRRLYAHHYCSRECQHKSMQVDKSIRKPNLAYKENWHNTRTSHHGERITMRCDHCGEVFSREAYEIRLYKNHYCSRRCHQLDAAKKPKLAKNK